MSKPIENLPDDPAVLKAMIAELQAENAKITATLRVHDQLVQALRLRIAKLQKLAFGKSSEKIEQLELALEDLLVAIAEDDEVPIDEGQDEPSQEAGKAPVLRRRPRVPDTTLRERHELDPGTCCPDCGGDLRVVGEDVSELLDMIAAQMKVIQIARIKKSCRRCEKMVQEPAPSRPFPGSMVGPNLLAHVLASKFDDHLPLYRQHEIFARMGANIPESTLVGWCGRAMKTLSLLIELIEADIMGSDLLHADDTPIRVLDRSKRDKGLGKGVKQGRIWAYVRDQRPWAGSSPPGSVYRFAPNWKEEHVLGHLANVRGILQADGHKGYAKLYAPDLDGISRLREAACWAHLRRDFHDFWFSTKSEIAREALDRIGKLYDIERDINGQPADVRYAARQKLSLPKVEAFFAWSEQQLLRIPGKSDLAKAFRYGLARQAAFSLFLTDGRIEMGSNAVERTIRPIANGWSLCTPFLSACKH
ncbi:transposase IS66 family [Roseobacter litoralis Och 149]|uniref:Transposase IS66 family n=1 Tax=Roseobacter litoralis (strain ATCC 49566 / DSM 6996 / JCM 21268 / NBRC 15278 / OCh 149) TaxID=391595 RepID=F7ZBI3_ROSLO|nr:transposase IS66 family [Roseobacter litoralis Och 149]